MTNEIKATRKINIKGIEISVTAIRITGSKAVNRDDWYTAEEAVDNTRMEFAAAINGSYCSVISETTNYDYIHSPAFGDQIPADIMAVIALKVNGKKTRLMLKKDSADLLIKAKAEARAEVAG